LLSVALSAAILCFVVLFLGQATLRLLGATEWSWLAPAIGLSVAMLLATPTMDVPGRTTTMAVFFAALSIAAAVWCLRSRPHRPPALDLLAMLPVAALVLLPFIAAGRGGILGQTLNNDTAVHLLFVEAYGSGVIDAADRLPPDYPLGPHALAALLSRGLGFHAEIAFSGMTMAMPLICAFTALAVTRGAAWYSKPIAATVVGLPFLVAAYYGQGAFKEVAQTALVLAFLLTVAGYGPRLGLARWVPLALLTGGIVSVYSPAGLLWPVAIVGLWLAGLLAIAAWRRQLRAVPGVVRRELPALGIGVGALLLALLPQAGRMWEFLALRDGSGIAVDDIGNLVGPLSGWQALGTWGVADFRLPAAEEFSGGKWSLFVLALVLFGAFRAFRRGRWLLPLTAAAAMAIWWYSDGSQSPYVAAKALVIASPLLLLLAVFPLTERAERGAGGRLRWPWLVIAVLALVLFVRIGRDDLRALRFSPVGPADQTRQLETFRPLIAGHETLYLGTDEYVRWQLAGAPPKAAVLASLPVQPLRPGKDWEVGEAIDFDSVPTSVLNEFDWIVAYDDPGASEPPAQLRLVRSTEDYNLWKRVAPIPDRRILREGEWPGAVLKCDTAEGRRLLAAGGVAAVRRSPFVFPLDVSPDLKTFSARLRLSPGAWELRIPYLSRYPIEVTAPGLRTTLPANLFRIGPRRLVGRVRAGRRPLPITLQMEEGGRLAPPGIVPTLGSLVATPADARERIVPIARACGRYVDWYRPASSRR
jgi:hypothetical protein